MVEQDNPNNDLFGKVEALLFVSSGLISAGQIAKALEVSDSDVEKALKSLDEHYKEHGHGIRLMRMKTRVQLTTAPELSKTIETFLGLEASSTLSTAALEALAIIAYKQPLTRPEVDVIRGVNSDAVMRTLLSKGLIEELGRAETPGRPILYGTTAEFLQYFGLESLDRMPFIDFDALEENLIANGTQELLKT
jgi:segregation and condensation protein B